MNRCTPSLKGTNSLRNSGTSENFHRREVSLVQIIPISTICGFLILLTIWFWCRNGSITSIKIVAKDDHYQAFVDDRLITDFSKEPASMEGGIAFQQESEIYWGIPLVQSLIAVKVIDNDSGELLLEQNFDKPLSPIWVERSGSCSPGRLGYQCDSKIPMRLGTGYQAWENYTVEVRVRNLVQLRVLLRYLDDNNYVMFNVFPFREVSAGFMFINDGKTEIGPDGKVYYKFQEIIKSIISLFLFYLLHFSICLILVFLAFALISIAVSFMERLFSAGRRAPSPLKMNSSPFEALFLIVLFLGSFVYLMWINYYLLDHIPHVQDSVVYNFQAQLLSRGRFFAPVPPNPPSFAFEGHLFIRDNKWFGLYPWGHPFLLMFGHLFSKPWIIPPLVGSLVLIIIYFIARELFSRKVAVVSSILAFFSPFFQINAPNFMSHSSGSFYLALTILFLIKSCKSQEIFKQRLYGFICGLSAGFLFHTRTLNAVPAILITGGVYFYFLCVRKIRFTAFLCFCCAGLLMLALLFFSNYIIIGSPFIMPWQIGGAAACYFGDNNPIGYALTNYYTLMTMFLMVIFGWPPFYTTVFFISFLLLARKNIWTIFLLLIFFSMTLANLFSSAVSTASHMYGPRYVYEPFFIYILIVTYGWDQTIQFIKRGVSYVQGHSFKTRIFSLLVNSIFLYLLVSLVFNTQRIWLNKNGCLFDFWFTPKNIYNLKRFNDVSGIMNEKIRSKNIHNALIFVEDHIYPWELYGALFTLNSPFLDSDIIVARDLGEQDNEKVIEAFPGRRLYRVNVRRQEIRGYRDPAGKAATL